MAICASCGQETPEGFPRCANCGALLEAGPLSAAEERKVVSVLFCDLVGFTAASDSADPEDVRARIRPYHQRLREVVERFGGTVEKFVGDAVMAVFGAPLAHEDDAERAVRAGLRILEAIEELNAQDASLALQVRVGINTGEAVVALGARPEQGEGIVTGDVVNTASRLQGAAPVNAVAVSEQTYRATERVFEWEQLEPVTVKGKAEPLALYRPLTARARFGTDVTRTHATPLVGRDLERTLLVSTFERAVQQQSCQLVSVVGAPGVGKSRLCMELFSHVEAQPGLVRWRQGRCLPYGDGIAFWALGEIVKAECGILESDSPAEVAGKLDQAVPDDDPERAWVLSRVAPLIGAPGEPASQEESFSAWRRFCEGLAAERTTVLVFEDLHWGDPALLAFLEHLADWTADVPLLLLCTARPELYEQHSTFGANARNAHRINLSPLTDADTARLVSSLLERAVLPAETQQALLEQAGGNPLYAEEFVRLLADRGRLEDVPESIHALIAARLDTLPPERKSLLQDASVLGKVFWAGALTEMGGRDLAEVEQALHELARKELVRPSRTSSMKGEQEYGFWHALVRDVCYGQIPRAARAARHLVAAAWIEEKAGERLEDLADVLAHHYQTALELGEAAGLGEQREQLQARLVRYLALAGERALSLDIGLAEQQLARALQLCPADAPERALLLERLGQATQQLGRLQDARQILEEAVAVFRARGDMLGAGRVLTRLGNIVHRLGDPQCEELWAESVAVLEALPPGPELVSAITYASGRRMFTGQDAEAVAGANRAIALAAELALPKPAFALHVRGTARTGLGDAGGLDDLREALALALEQGLGRETAVIYGNLCRAVSVHEGPRTGFEVLREAIAFSERRGMTETILQSRSGIPEFLEELGETERALAEAGPLVDRIQEAGDMAWISVRSIQVHLLVESGDPPPTSDVEPLLTAAREIGLPAWIAQVLGVAAETLLAHGDREQAHALLVELDESPATREVAQYYLPRLLRTTLALGDPALGRRLFTDDPREPAVEHARASATAQLAEAEGKTTEAAALYAAAAARWRTFGGVPELAYALLGQGRCLQKLGDPAAHEPLAQARELFSQLAYKPALAQTEALLRQSQAAASA